MSSLESDPPSSLSTPGFQLTKICFSLCGAAIMSKAGSLLALVERSKTSSKFSLSFTLATSPSNCLPRAACGCTCHVCMSNTSNSLDLHREIEELNSKLLAANNRSSQLEHESLENRDYSEGEISKLQDELSKLRDRYERLYESHKKLQKLNHNLEDKLIGMVSKLDEEKQSFNSDLAVLSSKLLEAKVTICDLEEESERYRNDCNMAVQLLQLKPSEFVAHKLNTLPLDLQERVKCHLSQQEIVELEDSAANVENESKQIRMPMMTFPPTAMLYSVNPVQPAESQSRQSPKTDTVPMDIITKVLAPPPVSRKSRRIYICSKCHRDSMFTDCQTQTECAFMNGYSPSEAFGYSQTVYSKLHRTQTGGFSQQCLSPTDSSSSSSSPPQYAPQALFAHQPGVHKPGLNSAGSLVDL